MIEMRPVLVLVLEGLALVLVLIPVLEGLILVIVLVLGGSVLVNITAWALLIVTHHSPPHNNYYYYSLVQY